MVSYGIPFTFSSGVKNIDTHDSLRFNVTIKDEQAPAEPEAPEAPVPLEINLDGDNGFILKMMKMIFSQVSQLLIW